MSRIRYRKRAKHYLVTGSIGTARIRITLPSRQEALWAVKLFRSISAEGQADRRAWGQQGGQKRAAGMTPERRAEIARQAVAARWKDHNARKAAKAADWPNEAIDRLAAHIVSEVEKSKARGDKPPLPRAPKPEATS